MRSLRWVGHLNISPNGRNETRSKHAQCGKRDLVRDCAPGFQSMPNANSHTMYRAHMQKHNSVLYMPTHKTLASLFGRKRCPLYVRSDAFCTLSRLMPFKYYYTPQSDNTKCTHIYFYTLRSWVLNTYCTLCLPRRRRCFLGADVFIEVTHTQTNMQYAEM